MTELIKIDDVTPVHDRWLRITFSDGAIKEVDVGELLDAGGVFQPIADDRALFQRVRVNEDTRTVEWPGGIDLDPDVLYGTFEPASGVRLSRKTLRGPTIAAQRA
jgi:hypothetical protein